MRTVDAVVVVVGRRASLNGNALLTTAAEFVAATVCGLIATRRVVSSCGAT